MLVEVTNQFKLMCALRIDKTYFPIDATFGLFFLKIKIFICASHRHRRLLHVAVFCMDNIAGCKKKKVRQV